MKGKSDTISVKPEEISLVAEVPKAETETKKDNETTIRYSDIASYTDMGGTPLP